MADLEGPYHDNDIDTLASLPGGVGNYMRVVEDVCDYVAKHADATTFDVARTVAKERALAPKSMEGYLGMLGRTVVERRPDDSVSLTALGRKIAGAPSVYQRARLMADALILRCPGVAEVLALYEQNAPRSLALKDI